ncbi:MAG: nucleoside-diphosphate kinase [Candidatus Contendobacter sp.]|nr:MAG: nucleoside-diphosphate kinase [Candidatus Contendobacter sp.]
MAVERTLSIIKPGAVARNLIGKIITRFEEEGLRIIAVRMIHLTEAQAKSFYAVHRERPFFGELVAYMMESPILALVLEGENAIARNRELMGATDPSKAMPGTIRGDFAVSVTRNTVHGSDSTETAAAEIAFFFSQADLFPRAS